MRDGYKAGGHAIEELHLAAFPGDGGHRLFFQFLREGNNDRTARDRIGILG